jgi:hypothetical protein
VGRNTLIHKHIGDYDELLKDFVSIFFILQDTLGYPVSEEGVDRAIRADRRGAKAETILKILKQHRMKDDE